MRVYKDVRESFLEKYLKCTTIQGECIVWIGNRFDAGYGRFKCNRKSYYAHILTYAYTNKLDPKSLRGYDIHHECQNRACVNSRHLMKLTRKEHQRREYCNPKFNKDKVARRYWYVQASQEKLDT